MFIFVRIIHITYEVTKMGWYPRENYLNKIRDFYHASDIIKVITGVRRCGKSCLMETIAKEIEKSGVNKENIIYFDLDSKPTTKLQMQIKRF